VRVKIKQGRENGDQKKDSEVRRQSDFPSSLQDVVK